MPIGDLLAQINGEKSTASSAPTSNLTRANQLPAKRKPSCDLRANISKPPRCVTPRQNSSQPPRPYEKPSQLQRSKIGNGAKPRVAAYPKPLKYSVIGRPSSKPIATPTTPKAPPKKGTFAEILARGQRAQAVMGQVGKIQHKKVEKGAIKNKEEVRPAPQANGKGTAGYKGTSRPVSRNGVNGNGAPKKDPREAAPRPRVATSKPAAEQEVAAKKVKKAAQATTGYTGTARPKPGNPTMKDAPRGGALLNAPLPRHGSSKRSRYEDMDDFIEYDEDGTGQRHDYASDGSSDMEAGMDELDVEERHAEYRGRQEDIEEERREQSRKADKELRKRKALETLRAGKRH